MTKNSIEVKVKLGGMMAIAALLMCCFAIATHAAEINVPATVTAGSGLTIPGSGSGSATLYVVGPGTAIKRTVQLGQEIQLSADELQNAGRYVISLDGNSATFFVTAGPVQSIAFLGTAIASAG